MIDIIVSSLLVERRELIFLKMGKPRSKRRKKKKTKKNQRLKPPDLLLLYVSIGCVTLSFLSWGIQLSPPYLPIFGRDTYASLFECPNFWHSSAFSCIFSLLTSASSPFRKAKHPLWKFKRFNFFSLFQGTHRENVGPLLRQMSLGYCSNLYGICIYLIFFFYLRFRKRDEGNACAVRKEMLGK